MVSIRVPKPQAVTSPVTKYSKCPLDLVTSMFILFFNAAGDQKYPRTDYPRLERRAYHS